MDVVSPKIHLLPMSRSPEISLYRMIHVNSEKGPTRGMLYLHEGGPLEGVMKGCRVENKLCCGQVYLRNRCFWKLGLMEKTLR